MGPDYRPQLKHHIPPEQEQEPLTKRIKGKSRHPEGSRQALGSDLDDSYRNNSPVVVSAAEADRSRGIQNQHPSQITRNISVQDIYDKINEFREDNKKDAQGAVQLEALKAKRYDELIVAGRIQEKTHSKERTMPQKAAIIDQLVKKGVVPSIQLP